MSANQGLTEPTTQRTNLLGLDMPGLESFFAELGEKPFRARQLMQWVHQHHIDDFDAMSNISKALREQLKETAAVELPEIISDKTSADGTRKWLIRMDCGNAIETVFIPQEGRGTLCISSQIGCSLNCTFCATARQGYNRNLTSHEIIGQLTIAQRLLQPADSKKRVITNVVFMGMGEPMLNLDNVIRAIRIMKDDLAYGLAKSRITVSTSGVLPGIERLRDEVPVALAISLHAPTDDLRTQLVPINKKYPLDQLLPACKDYLKVQRPSDRITFEYTLIAGVNDQPEHARQLSRLLSRVPSKINLIPFNPFPGSHYQRPSDEAIETFKQILQNKRYVATVRKTRGDDIDAACGQLAGNFNDRTPRSAKIVKMEQNAST